MRRDGTTHCGWTAHFQAAQSSGSTLWPIAEDRHLEVPSTFKLHRHLISKPYYTRHPAVSITHWSTFEEGSNCVGSMRCGVRASVAPTSTLWWVLGAAMCFWEDGSWMACGDYCSLARHCRRQEAVFSIVRGIYGREHDDPMDDLDVNMAFWAYF